MPQFNMQFPMISCDIHIVSILYPYCIPMVRYCSFTPHFPILEPRKVKFTRRNFSIHTSCSSADHMKLLTPETGTCLTLEADVLLQKKKEKLWKVSWNFRKRTWEIEFPILFQKIGHWTWTFWVEGSVPWDIRRWCTHRVGRTNEGAQPGCSLDIV